jgi:hypothetical protein
MIFLLSSTTVTPVEGWASQWPLLCIMHLEHTSQCTTYHCDNAADTCMWWLHVHIKTLCCITFVACFLSRNYTMGTLCVNSVSHYTLLSVWTHTQLTAGSCPHKLFHFHKTVNILPFWIGLESRFCVRFMLPALSCVLLNHVTNLTVFKADAAASAANLRSWTDILPELCTKAWSTQTAGTTSNGSCGNTHQRKTPWP